MKKVVVFSGHMIDGPDRAIPRFPTNIEDQVHSSIHSNIKDLGPIELGIASGASGGDIIFHECCLQLGISSTLVLPGNADDFQKSSVVPAGKDWVKRYYNLLDLLPVKLIGIEENNIGMDIYSFTNKYMLDMAILTGLDRCMLALVDLEQSGKSGGTISMITMAEKLNFEVIKIDMALCNK